MGACGFSPARRPSTVAPARRAGPMARPTFPSLGTEVPVGGLSMPLMAVAFPILPGKTAEWRTWMEEINGPRRQEFVESRHRAGVHERTFLQPTPMGDFVIVTLEGEDPGRAFGQMTSATDSFAGWFLERAKAGHGADLTAPITGSPSELVVDTGPVAVLGR